MSLVERLDEMRCGISGCSLVSFGDLSTGIALRTSATRALKQDYLDEILQQAALNFEASDTFVNPASAVEPLDEVLIATPLELRVFVRSQDNKSDVVCCVCENVSAVDAIKGYAQKIFHEVSGNA